MNTIVLREKHLTLTQHSTIYQHENRVDFLRFLIDTQNYPELDLEQITCYLFVILPNGEVGKCSILNFSNVLYKGKYLDANIPITTTITTYSGDIKLWLTFSYVDASLLTHYLPTNMLTLKIHPSQGTDGIIDPDESTNVFTELERKIDEINNSKIATVDILDDMIIMYSDNEKMYKIAELPLPSNIEWREWKE